MMKLSERGREVSGEGEESGDEGEWCDGEWEDDDLGRETHEEDAVDRIGSAGAKCRAFAGAGCPSVPQGNKIRTGSRELGIGARLIA